MTVTAPGDVLEAALTYVEAYEWPVFHVEEGGKRPLTRNGFKDASADPYVVRARWRRERNANIGIPTGPGTFDVLDVDGDVGRESLVGAVERHGRLPDGPRARTGRGWHFMFTGGSLATGAAILPGIDTRGDGGYIVAPPSRHESGACYEWIRPPTLPLPTPPRWLLELVFPAPPEARHVRIPARGVTTRYSRAAVEGEARAVAATPVGSRNHRLNIAAFSLGQLVSAGLDPNLVTDILTSAALAAGLTEREAQATIASGLTAGELRPRTRETKR